MVAGMGILVIVGIIFIFEFPRLWEKKWKKEVAVFSILLLIGTGLSIAQAFQVQLSNPIDWISAVYRPIYHLLAGWLK
ncbi:hypothetical protein PP175_00125 [Aneurinibacillus sp. Ricciae_BoGa-3]|uniref:hypothetical protein n=1 Tax=Aneurinibacillus sp. Ricciae_BoGa-3 TaxID=3022697 RepID=UPI00233FD4CB|nr:hypothetical protein [Aneurinibacillus sp. Ricciae_BoGa-3]WCK54545.1 hypothetical protein PP175_00125 [Aneurinibacillus sp. Ricciae_BoGa-3]